MSEGKYGHLPKPKDRGRKSVSVSLGDVELTPTHDKAGEWEEEGEALKPHAKHAPEESMLAKLGRLASEGVASATRPWAKMLGNDDEEGE